MPTVLESLQAKLRFKAQHSPSIQAPPSCIIWPDKERNWEAALTLLRSAIPNFLILGSYRPEERQGPALWLRAVLDSAQALLGYDAEAGVPVVYLPGWSRADLRAIAGCPRELQFLAEFQYRGVIFAHPNGRDWSPLGFFSASEARGGLGLDFNPDGPTRAALQNALSEFLETDIQTLRHQRIDAAYLNELIVSSPDRDILDWLESQPALPPRWTAERKRAFQEICAGQYGWKPSHAGPHEAARLLLAGSGPWLDVWRRYTELLHRYPRVYELLMQQKPPADLFADRSRYPSANIQDEESLAAALLSLPLADASKARTQILELEANHGARRRWPWAAIGKAHLALALEHLAVIAQLAGNGVGGDLEDYRKRYTEELWRIDDAALRAQEAKLSKKERDAVEHALRAVYAPWLEQHARRLQELSLKRWPDMVHEPKQHWQAGACWYFVDGLRYDLAMRLADMIRGQGLHVDLQSNWSALPSVTSIGKYLASPAVSGVKGVVQDGDPYLCADTGQVLDAGKHRAILAAAAVQYLDGGSIGSPGNQAWTEEGEIDIRGHAAGSKLAIDLTAILERIAARIQELLEAGWSRVVVVTDHGWLLMPGGLDKAGLPADMTLGKWGRSGVLDASAPELPEEYRWALSTDVRMISAPGARSFIQGKEYSHGGVSAQECIIPSLVIHADRAANVGAHRRVEIASLNWRRLRCEVKLSAHGTGYRCDIRTAPAKPDSSVVASLKPFHDGMATLIVDRDEIEGQSATVIVLNEQGEIVCQESTVVGGA